MKTPFRRLLGMIYCIECGVVPFMKFLKQGLSNGVEQVTLSCGNGNYKHSKEEYLVNAGVIEGVRI